MLVTILCTRKIGGEILNDLIGFVSHMIAHKNSLFYQNTISYIDKYSNLFENIKLSVNIKFCNIKLDIAKHIFTIFFFNVLHH